MRRIAIFGFKSGGSSEVICPPETLIGDALKMWAFIKTTGIPEHCVRAEKWDSDGASSEVTFKKSTPQAEPKKGKGRFAIFLGLLSLCLMPWATQAQVYSPVTIPVLAVITTNQVTNANCVIDCRKTEYVGLMISAKLMDTGTKSVYLYFDKSVDGSTWPTVTTEREAVQFVPNNTTLATLVTNIDSKGYGYLRLSQIFNSNSVTMTNVSIKYSMKALNL